MGYWAPAVLPCRSRSRARSGSGIAAVLQRSCNTSSLSTSFYVNNDSLDQHGCQLLPLPCKRVGRLHQPQRSRRQSRRCYSPQEKVGTGTWALRVCRRAGSAHHRHFPTEHDDGAEQVQGAHRIVRRPAPRSMLPELSRQRAQKPTYPER